MNLRGSLTCRLAEEACLYQVEEVEFQSVFGAAPCHSESQFLQRFEVHIAVVVLAVKH